MKRFAAVEKPEAGSEVAFVTAGEVEAEAKKKVYVRGPRGTSVRRDIEPRTGRGQGLAVEWPKGGCGLQAAKSGTDFKPNPRLGH